MGEMVKELSSYRGKRVFLTGDTGFKGSWLALWLSELGAEVHGFALPPPRPQDHYHVAKVAGRIQHTDGDVRDLGALSSAMRRCDPEYAFHLAAQPLVRLSYREPKETFDTNFGGSVNFLEAARKCEGLKSIVFITSDKCYRNREWTWGYRENDELGGHDPYSASKAAAEILFASYWDSFLSKKEGLGSSSARAGNVIGGGDWSEDRIIPDCIRALSAGDPIIIRNPRATRPWQHVLEPLGGYLLLGAAMAREPTAFSGAWNFGPDSGSFRTVKDLAALVIEGWGSGSIDIRMDPNAPHEAGLLHLNCDKARQELDWSSRWDFKTTVANTVSWYLATDKEATSLAQIRDYSEA